MAEEDSNQLPPLRLVKVPQVRTASARIRWALALGYSVKEISSTWGIKYQQVRNVRETQPKRATREDMPPLTIELMDPVDDIQAITDAELDRSLAASRQERLRRKSVEPPVAQDYDMELDPDEVEALQHG